MLSKSFEKSLRVWYRQNARDLPWRRTRDPYAIWISEVMLQQTQVATVISYYHRFLESYPTVDDLASAPESDVLRMWEGLGYYRRARQLHAAAKKIVAEHQGRFPTSFEEILKLPGIGRYTAGAIASFAFDQRQPILEANTQRLYSRLILLTEDPKSSASQKRLWEFAEAILPADSPGELNQALMELGSQICTPADPKCLLCPVHKECPTHREGMQAKIPATTKRVAFEERTEIACVIWKSGKVLLRRSAEGERWAGLWDFPRYHIAEAKSDSDWMESLTRELESDLGVVVNMEDLRLEIKHGVTRFRITLLCYDARHRSGPDKKHSERTCWRLPTELAELPMNVTARKIAKQIAGQK